MNFNTDKITSKNYHYAVDYDYDTERNCDEFCDNICRCSTIENAIVKKVCYQSLGDYIYDGNNELSFIFSWVCRLFEISEEDFEIQIERGYYGQEIGFISFNPSQKFLDFLDGFQDISFSDAVKKCLEKENNFILPGLENRLFSIEEISLKDICISNPTHFDSITDIKNLAERVPDSLDNIGVYLFDGTKFKIIDGYHRLKTLKEWIQTNKMRTSQSKNKKYKAIIGREC